MRSLLIELPLHRLMTVFLASFFSPATRLRGLPALLLKFELSIQRFILGNSKMLWNVAELSFAFVVVSLIVIADLVLG